MQINNGMVNCLLQANGHCNKDSLPLRFGVTADEDIIVQLKVFGIKSDKKFKDRSLIDGELLNNINGQRIHGDFIIKHNGDEPALLITVWRNDANTEFYLSETMKGLRKTNNIDTDWLLNHHKYYENGSLSTSSDLVNLLAKSKSEHEIARMMEVVNAVNDELAQEVKRAEKAERRAEIAERENERLSKEIEMAASKGSKVFAADSDILVSVEEDVFYRSSKCTVLTMGGGTRWYMKTSTFDPVIPPYPEALVRRKLVWLL